MYDAFLKAPKAANEPVLDYAPGSPEKLALKEAIKELKNRQVEGAMVINGKRITTNERISMHPPHEKNHLLGYYYKGGAKEVNAAITACLEAKSSWESMHWSERAAIFLKAADLISGPYRSKIAAATMLCQSKNAYQAEIDAVAELCDFFRFNVEFMTQLYSDQPSSSKNIWNQMEYRPLEGFIFALTPFNFTAISGNLPAAPAMMGNTVIWKPAESQVYSALVVMEILEEAGIPPGVINLIFVDGPEAGKIIFEHQDFAGLHFTGSTGVFQHLWKTIGENISKYKSYPRIVGETGGKDFVMVHHSANSQEVATGLIRGAYEYQGQKCSAASRAYVPVSLWPEIEQSMKKMLSEIQMGSTEDFTNFINAVIDQKAFDKITAYIKAIENDPELTLISGGKFDDQIGYFIEPTLIQTSNPNHKLMNEEIFGPVLTVYVYPDQDFESTMDILDKTSPYALTGAIFAKDRNAIVQAKEKLRHAAGNFYINDKPTGAVVGQQPFGGARGSGTNDKAGSIWNLLRWTSPRAMKENFVSPVDYKYPFMEEA
jgi:1-pyrroline-5-carboxylate dehydrogenase